MGETAELRNQLAGTFGFNDWVSQGDSKATIRKILRTMVPTVDMRDFQRRFKFISGSQAVAIGQRVSQVRFVVPENEAWRPIAFQFENGDSAGHQVEVDITVDNSGLVSIFRIVRSFIVATTRKLIYGTNQDGSMSGAADDQLYTSFWPVILEPTDVFVFTDLTTSAVATTQRWTFVYELVPKPATELTRGADGLVTVS